MRQKIILKGISSGCVIHMLSSFSFQKYGSVRVQELLKSDAYLRKSVP